MNIVLWGYWQKNLGDDLFLILLKQEILNKYPQVRTYLLTDKEYRNYYKSLGFDPICRDTFTNKVICRLLDIVGKYNKFYYSKAKNNIFLLLGGSLFSEFEDSATNDTQFDCLQYAAGISKHTYVIGSNFGPYHTERFLNQYIELFNAMDDVCFRDQQSANLFFNARFKPDVVLGYTPSDSNQNHIISDNYDLIIPINLEARKDLRQYTEEYEDSMCKVLGKSLESGKSVILMGFCKYEKDNETIDHIYNKSKTQYGSSRIHKINYEDIDTCISHIRKADKIYTTRFHGIILSILFNKTFIPIIYSNKSINALESYFDKKAKYLMIKDLATLNYDNLPNYENNFNECSNLKEEARNQFTAIRKLFK